MDGIASMSGVGAVASGTLLQAATVQVAVATRAVSLSSDVSVSALKLIQSAVTNSPASGHQLDVKA